MPTTPRVFLTTYRPLCSRKAGRAAVERFGIPPYVGGSCRREPDLESRWPSVGAPCHGRLFAPRLRPSDVVVFLAAKKRYPGDAAAGRRLVAASQVRGSGSSRTATRRRGTGGAGSRCRGTAW
jgi:hypothetical protein